MFTFAISYRPEWHNAFIEFMRYPAHHGVAGIEFWEGAKVYAFVSEFMRDKFAAYIGF